MASESIGSIYPTQIPGYDDAADIQAALKLYHYGSVTVPTVDEIGTDPGEIVANSIAGHLKVLDTRIDSVEITGVGSDYAATEPASPADGFIWINSSSSLGAVNSAVAAYQTSAPLSPVIGSLWVDNTNTNALVLKVYDGTTWKAIS
jgi:hypothetical protein